MDIYEIRKTNLRLLIGSKAKGSCATRWGMSPAHLSQVLSNKTKKNLGDDVARRIEECEALPHGWIDTLHSGGTTQHGDTEDAFPRAPSEDDYVLIPLLSAIGECGSGYMNSHVEVKGSQAFPRDLLNRMRVKPENLRILKADGDSMEPYIFSDDIVLIDTSDTVPKDRFPYAIRRADGSISFKRLMRRTSGTWLIRSDNPDKNMHPDEEVTAAALHDIPIIGRIIWRGGEM